jgi:branched-chain amino acid transport system substrate-binding protein
MICDAFFGPGTRATCFLGSRLYALNRRGRDSSVAAAGRKNRMAISRHVQCRNARILTTTAAAVILAFATTAHAADSVRGVTDTEIVIGSVSDLSGVTAVQGVNNANAVRLAFDEANAKGGINGRKIRFIVEDGQYLVARAVQAMNKLLNNDNVFITIQDSGTPMNNATMEMAHEKGVMKLLPLSAAVSMFEPFHKWKFAMFPSNVDLMRSGVKYFVENKGKKVLCSMYTDTDFGRDVLSGAQQQADAMKMQIVATTAHKPTDTDFNANLIKLRDANCDLVALGTLVKDTILILSTARKLGWNVDFLGQFATYDTAVAETPGGVAEGFYSVSPSLFAYPDDPRPEVSALLKKYKEKYGFDMNYNGQAGYSAAQIALEAFQRAGRNLTLDTLVTAMESITNFRDVFGTTYSFGPNKHQANTKAFLSVVKNGRWEPVTKDQLSY